ncbi:MAG: amino acid ABC transporter substrate-binding protein [Burkholderiaceae bacterium]|nr:amino acid ABC transporter substrate-binding protein [Burkholderiaceae bacterium]
MSIPVATLTRVGKVHVIAVLLAVSGFAAADTLSKIRETQTITLGYRETPPFSFTAENKQVTGYSIDVCLRVAEAVKKELKLPSLKIAYVPVDTTTRFTSVIDGTVDIECGSTTNNAERRKRVAFTISHFFSSVRMIVKQSSGIHNWADLKDRTLASTHNTTTIDLINARNNVRSLNLHILEGKDDRESFGYVESGKADAFAKDDVQLYSFRSLAKQPDDFVIVGEPLSVEPYSIMFRKDDPEFKKLVDHEVTRLITEGEMQKIYHHWFLEPSGPKGNNMNMPMGYLLRDSFRFPTDKTAD